MSRAAVRRKSWNNFEGTMTTSSLPSTTCVTTLPSRSRLGFINPAFAHPLAQLLRISPNGQPIGDIRKSWAKGCAKAGLMKPKRDREGNVVTQVVDGKEDVVMVPSKLFHDFRRTAARDIHDATKDKELAKSITGHKTDAMFDRYNI